MKKTRNIVLDAGTWAYDFTRRGRRYRRGGFLTKAQAEAALARKKTRLMDEELGLVKPAAEDVTFADFADQFLTLYCKPNKRSWQQDEFVLENLKAFFKGETLASIGPELVERYKAERKVELSKNSGKTISPATTNRSIALLKTLFSKAVEWGRIETNPASRVKKLKEAPGRERILTKDEAGRLIAAASPDIQAVLIVALGTGMRRGEILALKWTDLDFVRGVITITSSKSGKGRKVPMSGAVAEALGAVPRRGDYVFWNPETRTHVKDIKTGFRAACARAKEDPDNEKDPGITGVRFHDCRHTALTWMLQAGADIVTVSKIAGHASIVMTQRYCHASPESQRLAVERLGGILDSTRQKVDTPPKTVSAATPPAPSASASNRDN